MAPYSISFVSMGDILIDENINFSLFFTQSYQMAWNGVQTYFEKDN